MMRCVAIALPIILTGCANAISYHHAERVGIALEAKTTEPQQPLQGTIGIKTRTVVVAPGKGNTSIDTADPNLKTANGGNPSGGHAGEATSVISDFNLVRNTKGFWGQTILSSAFITGDAAVLAPPESSTALAGLGAGEIDNIAVNQAQILREIYGQLEAMAAKGDSVADDYINNLDALAKLLPDVTGNNYYNYAANNLTTIKGPARVGNFYDVLDYDDVLRSSLMSIPEYEKNPQVTLDNQPVNATTVQTLRNDNKRLTKERKDFNSRIGSSSSIDQAGNYVLSRM